MTYCIYTLSDPRTSHVRYVGRTTDLKLRIKQYHCRTGADYNKCLREWINELHEAGLKPVVTIIMEFTVTDDCKFAIAGRIERLVISMFEREAAFQDLPLLLNRDGIVGWSKLNASDTDRAGLFAEVN